MKTNVYVIYGGKSVEHEVSIKSALFIINLLDKDKYNVHPVYITKDGKWCSLDMITNPLENEKELQSDNKKSIYDSVGNYLLNNIKNGERNIVFPAIHGTNGEDGTIQGFLELLDIPYVGNGILASAVGIDKCVMRDLFKSQDIPQPDYISISNYEFKIKEYEFSKKIKEQIGFPCYIKPARLGSSVGITRCEDINNLNKAIKEAFIYDNKIIVEQEIIAREMQILVYGNNKPKTSHVGEISQEDPFLDYDIKYTDGRLTHIIPARADENIQNKIKKLGINIFKTLNASGLLRVDFFVTKDNIIYLNEVNTMPGFTKVSMVPDLWRNTYNTSCSELVDELISLGFERFEMKQSTQFSRRKLDD
ncbi:MAG: D-alanine--D-alanine ligase [Firmicutes bacterium]|nr:D-alanine--D-alanine ligase [Bacillota bacterium]